MHVKPDLRIIAAACLALHCQFAAAQSVVASWIQMAPGSSPESLAKGSYADLPETLTPTILARAVVSDGACPNLTLDNAGSMKMRQRFRAGTLTDLPGSPPYFVDPTATAPGHFANGAAMATTDWAECEAVIPAGHATAQIAGTTLKLPVAGARTILLIADTGCRTSGTKQQNCADPNAFPLAMLAGLEAGYNPDLIIHVGDWLYRDTSCLDGGAEAYPGCNTPTSANYEPWGDIFDSWNADVLAPMKPLLAAAPWIMVRGNHESCGRGARGWYALLDPHPFSRDAVACRKTGAYPPPVDGKPSYTADFEPTYVVPAGRVNFLVHDSSFANDITADRAMAENYDIELSNLLATLGSNSMNIFVTHRPSFGLVRGKIDPTTPPTDNAGDATEQSFVTGGTYAASAFAHGVPATIGLFLSGHIHQFQAMNFADPEFAAPQLIVGMGGTLLDADMGTGRVPEGLAKAAAFSQAPALFAASTGASAPRMVAAEKTLAYDAFGFAVLHARVDAQGRTTGYLAEVHDTTSTSPGSCTINLKPRSIHCDF